MENIEVTQAPAEITAAKQAIQVVSGVIRNGVAVVEGVAEPALLERLRVQALAPDGSVVAEAPVTAAAEPGKAPLPFTGRLQMHGHAGPIQECRILAEGAGPVPTTYEPAFQLRQLYYATPELFATSNVARKRYLRQPDNETQMFMARQMASMFATELDRRRNEPRVLMSCAFAYRATDVKAAGDAALAISLIDSFAAQLRTEPASDLNDRRLTSLLNAKWHAAAIADDAKAFEQALLDILSMAETMARNDYIFVFHFNPVRSLCVLAGYSILTGQVQRARQCFEGVRQVMSGAGRAMTFHPVHLQDFAKSCRIVICMDFFEEQLASHGQGPREALLARPIARLRSTVGEAALAQLIRPCIRSDNPEDVVVAIRRFAERAV